MNTEPIFIVGAARSGTSMVAGAVNLCGAFGGDLRGPQRINPKGMFENVRMISEVVKPLLRELGADPMGQSPLPDIRQVRRQAPPKGLRVAQQTFQIFRAEGWRDGPFWYKCPKLCHIWPIFDAAFPKARWLIVRRPDRQIIDSVAKVRFMHRHRSRAGWQGWLDAHKARFTEMLGELGDRVREIHYDRIMGGTEDLKPYLDWLDLPVDLPALNRFIDPTLWHNRAA
jgi:hypothetical protein